MIAVAVGSIVGPWVGGVLKGIGVGAGVAAAAGTVVGVAAGSIVSQGVGVATGIQDKFSWKSVGMAAIGAGVSAGLGKIGILSSAGMTGIKAVMTDVVRGALQSAITQGIGVATGLQKKFDWAGVAGAGVAEGVTGAIFRSAEKRAKEKQDKTPQNGDGSGSGSGSGSENPTPDVPKPDAYRPSFGTQLLARGAGLLANAATRSLINGDDFGDNITAALPDLVASTIGGVIADAVNREIAQGRAERAEQPSGGYAALSDQMEFVGGKPRIGGSLTDLFSMSNDAVRNPKTGTIFSESGYQTLDDIDRIERRGLALVNTPSDEAFVRERANAARQEWHAKQRANLSPPRCCPMD